MKAYDFLSDAITELRTEKIHDFISASETNFCILGAQLGLRPESDFQNADLSGVDFSGSDLSRHVFLGSDLSFSFGSDVVMPSPEALAGADLRMSPFAFFAEHSALIETARKMSAGLLLNDLDPTVTSEWVHDSARSNTIDRGQFIAKCLAFLSLTKSPTIAIDVTHAASKFFGSMEGYKDFLFWTISQEKISKQVKFACFSILAKVFDRDPEILRYLLRIVYHSTDSSFQFAAYSALQKSPTGQRNERLLTESIFGEKNKPIRRALIREALGRLADRKYYFLFEGGFDGNNLIIDYEEVISLDLWEKMCLSVARREFITNQIWRGTLATEAAFLADQKTFSDSELLRASVVVSEAFRKLAGEGIYFSYANLGKFESY